MFFSSGRFVFRFTDTAFIRRYDFFLPRNVRPFPPPPRHHKLPPYAGASRQRILNRRGRRVMSSGYTFMRRPGGRGGNLRREIKQYSFDLVSVFYRSSLLGTFHNPRVRKTIYLFNFTTIVYDRSLQSFCRCGFYKTSPSYTGRNDDDNNITIYDIISCFYGLWIYDDAAGRDNNNICFV